MAKAVAANLMQIVIDPIWGEAGPEGGTAVEGNLVGEVVTMIGTPPKKTILSAKYVDEHVARGWMHFEGSPVSLQLVADPNGPMKRMGKVTWQSEGDKLVLDVLRYDGAEKSPARVVYKITHFPIPQFFRHLDSRQQKNDVTEEEGVRIAPEYALELVSE